MLNYKKEILTTAVTNSLNSPCIKHITHITTVTLKTGCQTFLFFFITRLYLPDIVIAVLKPLQELERFGTQHHWQNFEINTMGKCGQRSTQRLCLHARYTLFCITKTLTMSEKIILKLIACLFDLRWAWQQSYAFGILQYDTMEQGY